MIALAVIAVLLVGGAIAIYVAYIADDSLPTHGPSMRPTMHGPAPIDVDNDAYNGAGPQRGDIVTAQAPSGIYAETCGIQLRPGQPCGRAVDDYSTVRVLKRVVAIPGDSVAFTRDGHLILNGERQAEPYIRACTANCAFPVPVTIPDDHYFLAGDNRPVSSDSRYWGAVPFEAIDGRVSLPCRTGAQDCPSD